MCAEINQASAQAKTCQCGSLMFTVLYLLINLSLCIVLTYNICVFVTLSRPIKPGIGGQKQTFEELLEEQLRLEEQRLKSAQTQQVRNDHGVSL